MAGERREFFLHWERVSLWVDAMNCFVLLMFGGCQLLRERWISSVVTTVVIDDRRKLLAHRKAMEKRCTNIDMYSIKTRHRMS